MGTLEKQRDHWPAFMKFKLSELAKEWSRVNKLNAAKKEHFHTLGPGGYAVARPKWDKAEKEMLDAGVSPITLSWPPSARLGCMRTGGAGTKDGPGFEQVKS